MLKMTYTNSDAALAERIYNDLITRGINPEDTSRRPVLVALISPEANGDPQVQNSIIEALDAHHHIIPLLVKESPLPRLIDHVEPTDFTQGYPINDLKKQVERLSAPDVRPPMTVLTPSVRRSNRTAALVVSAFAIVIFAAAIYMVGVLGLRAPQEEFNEIETSEAQTIIPIIAPTIDALLPQTEEEAANFETTLAAIREREFRFFVASTATAVAAPVVTTPEPENGG